MSITVDALTTLVSEEPQEFGGHTYTARRSVDLHQGMPRWQVFRDDWFTPVGFIQGHVCEDSSESAGLLVYDTNNQPLFPAEDSRGDGCVRTYSDALVVFHAVAHDGLL